MTPVELRTFAADKFRIEYPEFLPISAKIDEIKAAWQRSQLIIVGGETGSGKTTQLPKAALELGCGRNGMIGCTQPRRIAAVAMARRLAQELNCTCGKEVGSTVRFDDRTAPETVLKFMTDGILLAELRRDPLFRRYDCLIIDEAHERTLNIDFLLGLIRNILPKRPDLRVAVSSATLDVERFSEFFGNAPVTEVAGRTFPVEDIFLPPYEDEELAPHVARAVEELSGFDKRGDILVFLPGEREIRECAEMLIGRNYPGTEVLMLYSRLSAAEQGRVFHPGNLRRIILSTNVAETSLTIPRVKFCIDSGLARVSRYNPRRRIQELQIEMISQASARQRRGRCGRTADGICVHLYAEEDLQRADAYTDPEIKRTSLAGVILQMANLHLPDIRTFAFIDPPPGQLIREGFTALADIQAVNDSGRITQVGRTLARMPVDPHLGKMLLEAQKRKCLDELLVITAALSIADVKERPAEKPQLADQAHAQWKSEQSDYSAMLNCWNAMITAGAFLSNGNLRKYCKKNFLNFTRVREWRNLAADLAESMGEKLRDIALENVNYALVHESLLCGIPRNIAHLDPETRLYRGTDGKKFVIFPGSGLAKLKKLPEWIVCFSLVETSRLFGRNAAVIQPEWVVECAPHLCSRTYDSEHFESASGYVRAREKVSLGSLLLHAGKRVDFAKHNLTAAREIFIREGLLEGLVNSGKEMEKFNALRAELLEYEVRMRRPGALYDGLAAENFFRKNLPLDVASAKALKDYLTAHPGAWKFSRTDLMPDDVSFDPADYPGKITFSNISFKLRYRFEPGESDDGVTIFVPETSLNLLPAQALSYPIPGYCADFAEILLRALPKDLRRQLGGIPQCAALFAEELKRDPALRELPPGEAMADYLAAICDIEVNPRVFDNVTLPEYLQMKLGILNPQGRLKAIERELPESSRRTSRVAAVLPGADMHRQAKWEGWDGIIPESVELPPGSGRKFFPALSFNTQDGSFAKELFLKSAPAEMSHRQALCRLFMLDNAQLLKFIKRGIKFSNELKLSLLVNCSADGFTDDLLCASLIGATDTDLATVRSRADYENISREIAGNWSNTLDELLEMLEKFSVEYSAIRQFARRAKGAGKLIEEHLEFLFAPGFLKRNAVLSDYRRYLRALKLRAQRAADAPGKDLEKYDAVEQWIDRFNSALTACGGVENSPALMEFWELLEEVRIAVFAPEVKTAVKSPLAKLEKAWEELRL
ncbi:MAG: ATP-dependent RNA helicase HrpA [Lentisphaerae bacterium]|nr:ATP-dependent RNA helicase HrpA [Lentisphaerota bacterium]